MVGADKGLILLSCTLFLKCKFSEFGGEKVALTKREKDVLSFLKEYINANGYPPTVREIRQHLYLQSTSTVHNYLEKLEKKGYIKRKVNSSRAIFIVSKTEEGYACPGCGQPNNYDVPGPCLKCYTKQKQKNVQESRKANRAKTARNQKVIQKCRKNQLKKADIQRAL
jgi:DNA-binding MarR family transcriptional regulator